MIAILAVIAVVAVAALYGLHRLALVAERRGWLYYRNTRRPLGVGLGLLAAIYNPAVEHVVDEGTSARARLDEADHESGDGREPSAGGDPVVDER